MPGRTTQDLSPGTYRIVSGLTGTVIQISDGDSAKVVLWERHEGDNQHWFVQRSGDGYTFKNRRYGSYIAVLGTEDMVPLHASKYPMTWELLKLNDCYGIQFPGNSRRVFDLHCCRATNGNIIHLWSLDDHRNKTWKFEHLSDETGEVPTDLPSCKGRDSHVVDKGEKPAKRRGDIPERFEEQGQMKNQVPSMEQQLSEQRAIASQHEATIRQLQEIIKVKDEALAHAYKSNEEVAYLRDQQTQLQIKLLQSEMASLRAKVDRLEYPQSQVSKDEGSTYHGTYGGA